MWRKEKKIAPGQKWQISANETDFHHYSLLNFELISCPLKKKIKVLESCQGRLVLPGVKKKKPHPTNNIRTHWLKLAQQMNDLFPTRMASCALNLIDESFHWIDFCAADGQKRKAEQS